MDQQVQLEGEDTFQIQAEVCDPNVKDGLQKYVVYTFKGTDKHGTFDIQRRYNDFDVFRAVLSQRWPGCYVPPLPQKKAMGNMDQKFIDERKRYLDMFVKKLATLRHLWYSDEAELFKRTNGDVEKLLNSQKQSVQDMINKYEKNFHELSGKEINGDILAKIGQFQVFLKKTAPRLAAFLVQAKSLEDAKIIQYDNMNLLLDYLMPEYEKNCLTEYVVNPHQKLVFLQQSADQLNQMKVTNLQSSFEDMYLMLKIESREIDALIDAFGARERYEQLKQSAQAKQRELAAEKQSVELGKATLKSFFKQNKEEHLKQISQSMEQNQKEVENLQFMQDIITIIIGYVEMANFKADKEQKYLSLLKSISYYEIEKAKMNQEYWGSLLQNTVLNDV